MLRIEFRWPCDTRFRQFCRVSVYDGCLALVKLCRCRECYFTECGTRQRLFSRVPDIMYSIKRRALDKEADSSSTLFSLKSLSFRCSMEDINAPFILLVTLTLRRSESLLVGRETSTGGSHIRMHAPFFALLHFVKHACTCSRLRAMRERDSWLAESTARSFLLFKQQCRNSPCVSQPLTQHTTRVNYRSHRSFLPIPPREKKTGFPFPCHWKKSNARSRSKFGYVGHLLLWVPCSHSFSWHVSMW